MIDPRLDPEMAPILQRMLERMAERALLPPSEPQVMRARAAADFAVWNEEPPPMAEVRDFSWGARALPARLYTPSGASADGGLLIYFHGGGWVIGDIAFEDRACRSIALASGAKVLSIGYRLAPEARFPAPIEDCADALVWARAHANELHVDPARIALGGASAGANLTAAATLLLRDRGVQAPSALVLLYGSYEMGCATESHRLFGDGSYGLGNAAMEYFMSLYLRDERDRANPLASPLLADVTGFPPTFVAIAGLDPLRDDSRRFVAKLQAAGVALEVCEYPGVLHGFTQYSRASAQSRKALADAGAALKGWL